MDQENVFESLDALGVLPDLQEGREGVGDISSPISTYGLASVDLADLLGVSRQAVHQMASKLGYKVDTSSPRKHVMLPWDWVRHILESRGYEYQKRAITFQISKGGTGKTLMSKNFGVRAAAYGYKVLFIDLDHQADLTQSFGLYDENAPVVFDFFHDGEKDFRRLIKPVTENIGLVPSNLKNDELSHEITRSPRYMPDVFGEVFRDLQADWDLIICDCPPASGPHIIAAFLGSDTVISPVAPDEFSGEAIKRMLTNWLKHKKEWKVGPKLKILINRHDPRIKANGEKVVELISNYPDYVYPIYVRSCSDFFTSQRGRSHLWDLTKKSPAAEDIDIVVRQELQLESLNNAGAK